MRKILVFLLALLMGLSAAAETVFEFNSDEFWYMEKDGFSVYFMQGEGSSSPYYDAYIEQGPEVRVYPKNTITVEGTGLTNIQIVFAKNDSKTYITTLTPSVGTVVSGGISTGRKNPVVDTWTGNASEVVFTLGDTGQRVIRKLVINGATINPEDEIPSEPAPLPTAEDLQTDYIYAEPTLVSVPDTTISKKEYAFIRNNVLVHCSQGSILKESTSGEIHPAYFNCNADYELSFTASQAIQKIEIDGFLRKAFTASCDHGIMTDEADEDYDVDAYPAITITGINSKDATISCIKQVRCYAVRVYFKTTPTSVETTNDEGITKTEKILIDGQLYIRRGDKMYDLQGKMIKN